MNIPILQKLRLRELVTCPEITFLPLKAPDFFSASPPNPIFSHCASGMACMSWVSSVTTARGTGVS